MTSKPPSNRASRTAGIQSESRASSLAPSRPPSRAPSRPPSYASSRAPSRPPSRPPSRAPSQGTSQSSSTPSIITSRGLQQELEPENSISVADPPSPATSGIVPGFESKQDQLRAYKPDRQKVINQAKKYIHLYLATLDAFPAPDTAKQFIQNALDTANEDLSDLPLVKLTNKKEQLVRSSAVILSYANLCL